MKTGPPQISWFFDIVRIMFSDELHVSTFSEKNIMSFHDMRRNVLRGGAHFGHFERFGAVTVEGTLEISIP